MAADTLNKIFSNIDPNQIIQELALTENSIHNKFSELFKVFITLQTKHIEYFKQQKTMIEKTFQNSTKFNSISGNKKFNHTKYTQYIETLYKDIDIIFKQVIQFIEKSQPEFHNYDEYFYTPTKDYKGNSNLEEYLYYFQKGSKNLFRFNPEHMILQYLSTVTVNENQGVLAPCCTVSENRLFYAGGYGEENLNNAYLITLDTYDVINLPQCGNLGKATATYFNNYVFIFGGYETHNARSEVLRYNLVDLTKQELSCLPSSAVNISALPCEKGFIISPIKNLLYNYSWSNDVFISLAAIPSYNCNILFRDNGICYYICDNNVYTCNDNNKVLSG
ncbi:hypothetical protein SteCoe_22976 [Stentor coeruleus]|uniref:Uncharacterized protein n=1 Tax=Stentor coeruleus TaxID=5963 RepID=A0A1R2BKV8_9CILI|nr:hypothetical protein SteCoe_22976 [Stentor coeruleus]